eukprot:g1754.t1
MKTLENLRFENSFINELPADKESTPGIRQVFGAFYSFVEPSPTMTSPYLIAYSKEVCQLLDLDPEEVQRPEFRLIMSGQSSMPQTRTYAQCYGGHQFGSWAGQLGDGRAINFGEVLTDSGQKWEGVGKTPYSRFADGRAVLRSSLREYVASEALYHLGVPTTRALSLVGTGDSVTRDMFYNGNSIEEPGAVVCRVAPSFIRFGTFQLPASRGGNQLPMIKQLTDWVIRHHYPHLVDSSQQYIDFFKEVCERTALMAARWQTVGFVHGVLNTDNMSILGLTIDYGPFGFIDNFDPQFSPNITDITSGGRYAFQNQSDICQWNLIRLGDALCRGEVLTTDEIQDNIHRYEEVLMAEYSSIMAKKFGLRVYDRELTRGFLQNLYKSKGDFTNAFRSLGTVSCKDHNPVEIPSELLSAFGEDLNDNLKVSWLEWLASYQEALEKNGLPKKDRTEVQNSVNPKYIPRQHLLHRVINETEKGNYQLLEKFLQVLRRPYDDQENAEEFTQPPSREMIKPGVCYLSCSS